MNRKRFQKVLNDLNSFTHKGKGINRLAFSKEEREAKSYIKKLLEGIGIQIYEDSIGNLICRKEGRNKDESPVTMGSHIDTVYEAGKYDGVTGVVAGIEILFDLWEKKIETDYPIELLVFTCEESARFGVSTIGSKYMTGQLDPSLISALKDKDGITLSEALKDNDLSTELNKKVEDNKKIKCFIELHIEQGPVLEKEKKQIGIVENIASSIRYKLEITGSPSHSGTTPYEYRKDAFLGAVKFGNLFQNIVEKEQQYGTLGTIGNCIVSPGAMNTVPGNCELLIDIRVASSESGFRIQSELNEACKQLEKETNIKFKLKKLSIESPVSLDKNIIDDISEICNKEEISYKKMNSGAGHDAMNLAKICETGLLFIPSKNGISHNPEEFSDLNDIEVAVDIMKQFILSRATKKTEVN